MNHLQMIKAMLSLFASIMLMYFGHFRMVAHEWQAIPDFLFAAMFFVFFIDAVKVNYGRKK